MCSDSSLKVSAKLEMTGAPWGHCTHAIVVCGHAIFVGGRSCSTSDAELDKNWILQSFQRGEGVYYLRHLERGVELAAGDVHSLLILSGGQTRVGSHQSEGQSYYEAALAHRFWGHDGVAGRTTTEDFARDSYENVLFGIARFREATGSFPLRMTVISWRFKEARFVHHALTVRWPISRFWYEGVCNPKGDALAPALVAEERTLQAFQRDPTGSTPSGTLVGKRNKRNPYRRQHGYCVSSPELNDAFAWQGLAKIPAHMIPWEVDEEVDHDESKAL